jgi:hypothetical protein
VIRASGPWFCVSNSASGRMILIQFNKTLLILKTKEIKVDCHGNTVKNF